MKLEYSENRKYGKLNTLIEIACAVIMGLACLYVLISMFGLSYGPSKMFTGSFGGGLAGIWDAMAEKLGNVDYIILPRYKADISSGGQAKCGLALTAMWAVFSAISFLVIKSKSRLLAMIPAVVSLLLMFFWKISPSAPAGIFLAAATILVLTVMGIRGKIKLAYFIVPLAAMLAAFGLVLAIENTVTLDEPKSLSDIGRSAWEKIDKARYGEDPLPHGNVGSISGKKLKARRGDITSIKEKLGSAGGYSSNPGGLTITFGGDDSDYSDTSSSNVEVTDDAVENDKSEGGKTALTVTMSEPDSYYLRGFVGADYGKNKWTPLSNSTFYSMRDTTFWLNRRGFDGLSELSYASKLGSAVSKRNKLRVKVDGASKNIAFTPYELTMRAATGEKARKSEMLLPEGTKNYGGAFLGTEGFGGKSSYTYYTSENITGMWTDAVGKFYTTLQTEEIRRYFISESHYNVLQYKHYLDVPENLVQVFETEIGPTGDISTDHKDYKEAMETISTYLRNRFIYSDSFTKPKKNKDFVQDFIEQKRGSDIHFATLATLLFRYYGIPARYVEGYLVTPNDVTGETGETTVKVTKQANHAWTEIYIDGFGWVPVEATPEYSGIMKEADLSIGLQNVDYEEPQQNNEDEEEEDTESEDSEENDDLTKALVKFLKILLIAVVAILLLILLFKLLMMFLVYYRWKKAFEDRDPKVGIKAMYQYSKEKKWKLSSMGESLGLVAAYSKIHMEESDRTLMKSEFEKAKAQAQKEKEQKKAAEKAAKEKEKKAKEEAKKKEKADADQAKAQVKKENQVKKTGYEEAYGRKPEKENEVKGVESSDEKN